MCGQDDGERRLIVWGPYCQGMWGRRLQINVNEEDKAKVRD